MSVDESALDTLSTILSEVPSISNSEDLYPELARSTELANAMKAQELYLHLMENLNATVSSDDPAYIVGKMLISYSKRIKFKALCEGYTPETPEFNDYLNVSLRNKTKLVDFLKANGVDIEKFLF